MVTPTAKPIPFFPIEPQSITGFGPYRRHGRGSRGTHSGRGRAPRGRRGRTTSTTSCQTSPIPSYFWLGYQPSLVSSRGPSAGEALNLATMPRAFDHFPGSLPSSPLHYDYFTVLRAASPVVIFHCPSPFTQQSFSSVYSISFPMVMIPNLSWLQESTSKYYYFFLIKYKFYSTLIPCSPLM